MSLFVAMFILAACALFSMAQGLPHRSPVPNLLPPEIYCFNGTPQGFVAALDDYATNRPRSPETLSFVSELQGDVLIKDHYLGKLVSQVHRIDVNFPDNATTFYNTRQSKRHVLFDFA